MPLETEDLRHLEAAQGYIALGLYFDANNELEEIDAFCRAMPEVLAARMEIYRKLRKWDLMREVAKRFLEADYADEPTIAYNLACYCVQDGNMGRAKELIQEAFKRNPALRAAALDEPDLQPLWASM